MKTKLSRVIMLPTERHKNAIVSRENRLFIYKSNNQFKNDRKWHLSKYFNLYITTDDEIKEGDWCYDVESDKKIVKCLRTDKNSYWNKYCKKIIATTDKSLLTCNGVKRIGESCTYNNNCKYPNCKLPTFKKSFIEEYCRAGGIDEVLVECEQYGLCIPCNQQGVRHCAHPEECGYSQILTRLKVDSHNTITIHLIKKNL